jgi:hypothetical protein
MSRTYGHCFSCGGEVEEQVAVQVVEIAITPQLTPSERLREAETEPFHHGELLHTQR